MQPISSHLLRPSRHRRLIPWLCSLGLLQFSPAAAQLVPVPALWRFRDANHDGQADGPPERLLSLNGGEHGGHAIRKGPDGAWYVIGGNDSKFNPAEIDLSSLPAQKIEGGALL